MRRRTYNNAGIPWVYLLALGVRRSIHMDDQEW